MGFALAVPGFFTLPHYRQGESSVAGKTAEAIPLDLNGKGLLIFRQARPKWWCELWDHLVPTLREKNTRRLIELSKRAGQSPQRRVSWVSVDWRRRRLPERFYQDHGLMFQFARPYRKIRTGYGR